MGSSKQTTNQNYSNNQTSNQRSSESWNQGATGSQQTIFDSRSNEEAAILDQYRALGESQGNFLQGLMTWQSPFALNDADQATLDRAYQSAMDRYRREGTDYADYLATTRGLNKSDTPVSGEAMNRFGMGLADLESQKANAALNLGLQGTQMRLMGAQSLPAGLGAAFMPMFNERMAGGRTTSSQNTFGNSSASHYSNAYGSGNSTTTQRNTPSLMSQIGQGMGLASQAIGLGAQIGGLAMGMPTMGGMGGMMGGGGGNPFLTSMGGGGGYANSGLDGVAQFAAKRPSGMGSGASYNFGLM